MRPERRFVPRKNEDVVEDGVKGVVERGQKAPLVFADVVFSPGHGEGEDPVPRDEPPDFPEEFHRVEPVDLKGCGIGKIHENGVVAFPGLFDERPAVFKMDKDRVRQGFPKRERPVSRTTGSSST